MSVIGFDFGNFSSYVALVRTGGIDTIDNEYSYRATPTCVSFNELMRFSGNSSKIQAITNFKNTFSGFKNLIGLLYNDPIAQIEMSYLPSKFIQMDDGTIGVQCHYLGKYTIFSIVQLVSIMLVHLKNVVLIHTPIATECVLSVPNFFTDVQRRYIVDACQVAEIRPIALINDTAAVCYNYALFKTELPDDDKPSRTVMFVDVGYSCTQVCIANFNKSKVKILASLGDNTIGGRVFDAIIANKFCDEFYKKFNVDIKSNKKAYLKLLNECEAVKKQMNTTLVDLPVKIECLIDEMDLISKINREEFDNLSQDIYTKLYDLILQTIQLSSIPIENIHSIETVGGSSRIIGIRSTINKATGKDIFTTLNSDEAVSRGCAIQCALLSPVIRIRSIELKDISCCEYGVKYRNKDNEEKTLKVLNKYGLIPNLKDITFPATMNHEVTVFEISKNGLENVIGYCRSFGKSQESCNADKLVYTIRVELSNIFSFIKAVFVENRKVQQEEQPKSTQDEQNTTDNNNVEEKEPSTKTIKINHQLELEFKRTMNISDKIPEYLSIEKEMQQKIDDEKSRSSAKNALEEFIYSSRDKLSSTYNEYVCQEELEQIQNILTEKEDWLYNDGEFVTTDIYENQYSELDHLILPIKSRYEGFTKSFNSLDNLSLLLVKYRKFIETYKPDITKYEALPDEDIQSYMNKINHLYSYVIESVNTLKNQPKTKLPPINSTDIDSQIAQNSSFFEGIIKKSLTPIKKPAKTEPTPDTVPNNTNPADETNIPNPKETVKNST